MASRIKTVVNGVVAQLKRGRLIDALREQGLNVPAVCYHPDISTSGGRCRVCCCTVNGRIVPTCDIDVREGMEIVTTSPELDKMRDAAIELVPHDDVVAGLVEEASKLPLREGAKSEPDTIPLRKKSKYILRHPELCTHCGLCTAMCQQVQGVAAIADVRTPTSNVVEAFHNANLPDSECVSCGQCINVCPTGALEEASDLDLVEDAMNDPNRVKVVQFAPAVRLALAEEFGCAPGERQLELEMVEAVRKMAGHKNIHVFDTDFTADLTIIEEGNELLERLRRVLTGKKKLGSDHMEQSLPMITSCSPGWILFCEKNYHDLLPNLSSCKSPQQMSGALTKHYWAKKHGLDPKDIVSISVMPCVAKKAEKERPEFSTKGVFDVDHVVTTREFAKLCRAKSIDPTKLKGEPFDLPYGMQTSAGLIFGATGGVMEAALRTAYEVVTGRQVPFRRLNIIDVRGMQGVKEASIPIKDPIPEYAFLDGVELKVAVAHGLGNARKLMDRVRAAAEQGLPPPYHFIEVMACPGGCLGGGGQPKPTSQAIKMERMKLMYQMDEDMPMRRSHENPAVLQLYKEFLKEPLGHNSHELLHTKYTPREPEACSLISGPEAKAVRTEVLYNKYPENSKVGLTNMLSDIVDKFGYVSDAAIAAVAAHVGASPVAIDSIVSHYHFFHRTPQPKSNLYVCDCLTCRGNGSRAIVEDIRKRGMKVHTLPWLGWCVAGSPAGFVKHEGDPRLHELLKLTPDDSRIKDEASLSAVNNPQEGIKFRTLALSKTQGESSKVSIFNNIELTADELKFLRDNGKCPVSKKIDAMSEEDIIKEVQAAGLRGCGGAGFPTHIKWRSVRGASGKEKYVVVNADEGLPSTFKDFAILADPNSRMRMIIGMCTAARVVGAKTCVMYLRYEYKNLIPAIEETFKLYTTKLHPSSSGISLKMYVGGGPYVCGEETALFESVEGHAPQARCHRAKFATEQGLHGVPTCVNNVETLAWIPSVLYHGGQSFADMGLGGDKGAKMLSITGNVEQPTVGEFRMGTTLREALKVAAPEIPEDDIAAVEVGGMVEKLLVDPKVLDMPLSLTGSPGTLAAGGSIVVFRHSQGFDLGSLYQTKAKFAHKESCQLCSPCRDGTKLFREHATRLIGNPRSIWERDRKHMLDLYLAMESFSNCGHGKACGKMARELLEERCGKGTGTNMTNPPPKPNGKKVAIGGRGAER